MMEQTARQANVAAANRFLYDATSDSEFIDGSPHLKHSALRELYMELVVKLYDQAARGGGQPAVLDIGAGEGTVTLPFLALGANVTSVDVSPGQLEELRRKCGDYSDSLQTRCEDVFEFLGACDRQYDIIVANSFLHHIPDYLGLLELCVPLLKPGGRIFTFQDPIRYDSLGTFARRFSTAAYLSWRVCKGDLIGGAKRRLRRSSSGASDARPEDLLEYHVIRNGVDQDAIVALLENKGLRCEIVRYFATQSRVFQRLGKALRVRNMFAVIASAGE